MQSIADKENYNPQTPSPIKKNILRSTNNLSSPLKPLNDGPFNSQLLETRTLLKTPKTTRNPKEVSPAKDSKSIPIASKSPVPNPNKILLDEYAAKHRQLRQSEQQVQRLKFELLELASKIEENKREQMVRSQGTSSNYDIYKQAHIETTKSLEGLTLADDEPQPHPVQVQVQQPAGPEQLFKDFKNKASNIFVANEEMKNITKKASSMFNINNDKLRKTASSMFQTNHSFKPPQSDKLDDLSNKTNQFFTDVITTLSPKKMELSILNQKTKNTRNSTKTSNNLIDSSFNLENISTGEKSCNDSSFIYEDDDYIERTHDTVDYIDIDEYNSDDEDVYK